VELPKVAVGGQLGDLPKDLVDLNLKGRKSVREDGQDELIV
jgi:hypothetical protein